MVEYANESYPAWKKANEDMDKRYKQLMKEAEQEPKKTRPVGWHRRKTIGSGSAPISAAP
jgi:hypothetical protein